MAGNINLTLCLSQYFKLEDAVHIYIFGRDLLVFKDTAHYWVERNFTYRNMASLSFSKEVACT